MSDEREIGGPDENRRSNRSLLAPAAVLTALAVLAALLVVGRNGSDPAEAEEVSPPATALVSSGDLTISDRLDGSVVRSSELVVVHRISGESPGAAAGSSGAANPAAGGSLGGSAVGSTGLVTATRFASVLGGLGDGSTTTSSSTSSTSSSTSTSSTSTSLPSSTSSNTTEPVRPTSTAERDTTTTSDDGVPNCPPDDGAGTTSTTISSSTTDPTGPSTTPTTAETDEDDCTTTTTTATTSGSEGREAPTGAGGVATGGGSGAVSSSASGQGTATSSVATEVVTSTRNTGDEVTSGDVLYSIEGRPVIALFGEVPAWRDLDSSVDDGVDVLQLETALAALGYDADGDLTIDEEYDADTVTAVGDWQEGLGLERTGEVALGSIVFISETATVTATLAATGDEVGDGTTVLRLGTSDEEVTATVPEELRAVVTPGLQVEVLGTTGVVTRLGSSSSDGTVSVIAHISVDGELSAEAGADATVRFTLTQAADVLLVPVEAVASLLDGSYAVRLDQQGGQEPDGAAWVPVTILGVSGGQAAVAGEGLGDGIGVVVPG